MNNGQPEMETVTLAETSSFIAWKAKEPDGESTYHIELNGVTLHFFEDEWQEFKTLIKALV